MMLNFFNPANLTRLGCMTTAVVSLNIGCDNSRDNTSSTPARFYGPSENTRLQESPTVSKRAPWDFKKGAAERLYEARNSCGVQIVENQVYAVKEGASCDSPLAQDRVTVTRLFRDTQEYFFYVSTRDPNIGPNEFHMQRDYKIDWLPKVPSPLKDPTQFTDKIRTVQDGK